MQLQLKNSVRRRGAILTAQGLRKLNQAKSEAEIEQNLRRYTLEALSTKTGLTPNTLSKIFIGSVGVDLQTLQCCFKAFNLTLETDDYLYLKPQMREFEKICSTPPSKEPCPIDPFRDSPLETLCQDIQTAQTHNRHQPQDNLQPRPSGLPGGQMPMDSSLYINRPPVESLCYEAIQQPGAMLNIRAPKQMGKTSLMTRILAYAKSLGYQTVSLNLQLADAEILQNLERFLQWFCARVGKDLGLSNVIADFWDNSLGSKANATDYFNDVILAKCDRPLVIAIDELNHLFAYSDIAREFLLLLRTWSEQAKTRVTNQLQLVTVHSTEILMPSSINPSFFNAGLVINLPEFTPAQVQDLANRYEQEITEPQIDQLITFLGGHPYRLQLAFYSLHQQRITLEELLENSEIALTIYAEHLQQQWWNLQRYSDLRTVFTQIVRQSSPVDCEAEQGSQLQQMGLVHLQGFQASLACELFRPFFHQRLPQLSS